MRLQAVAKPHREAQGRHSALQQERIARTISGLRSRNRKEKEGQTTNQILLALVLQCEHLQLTLYPTSRE